MAQCEGISKRTGERCTAPAAAKGNGLCAGHAGLGKLDPAGANAKSAEVRKAKAERRKMSALDWAAKALEDNAEMIAKAFIQAIEKGDWRAAQFLYERVHGKPTERVETAASVSVDEMTPEQREQLRREIAEQYPHLRAVG